MIEFFFVLFVLFLVLFAEIVNGWTDAPNAIATVISTRSMSPRIAIVLATVLNILGAFSGTAVAATIATEIVKPESINLAALSSALLAVIIWGFIAWRLGLPMSKSHSLIAGLSGAALAATGPSALVWEGWYKVLLGMLYSILLGGLGGALIAALIQFLFAGANPSRAKKNFGRLQILSSAWMSFSHGSNDGQKFIGIFALTLLLGGVIESFYVPFWVIVICSLTMGLGTSLGGLRIIKTMGYKIVHLETYQGFSAEVAAASTITLASTFGIPLSTTHTISTAIMGAGIVKRPKQVHWGVIINIFYAWLFTFPICGLIAFALVHLFKLFHL